jgi:hypothetical protein
MNHGVVASLRRLGLIAGLALSAAAGAARPAVACSPVLGSTCSPGSAFPRDGAVVPASLPALGYTPARLNANSPLSPDGFQLLDGGGDPVAVTIEEQMPGAGGYFIRPKAPLAAGATYKVRYPQTSCAAGTVVAPIAEQTFTTTMAIATPTLLGTAAMTGHKLEKITVGTVSGTCGTEITAVMAHVTVQPSPELRAYLAVGSIGAYVNGQAAPTVNQVAPTAGGTVEFDVFAGCIVKDQGAYRGLDPGKYKLELRAHVFGEAVDPLPIWTDITLDCNGASEDDAEVSGGACAVAPAGRGTAGWAGLLGMIGLLGLALRSRKGNR